MIRTFFLLLLFGTFQLKSIAQDKSVDAMAASIPEANSNSVEALAKYIIDNFNSESDRIRAVYVWITNHINYDVAKLLARDHNNPSSPPQTVADVLATKNAVCQGYADLFCALSKEVGINAVTVSGYTKKDGKIAPLSHAWVAAPLEGQWYLFDPTWGAGYVRDDKFVKRYNNAFYKVAPPNFINDHMPFDPMYEFLNYPLGHKDFMSGTQPANKVLFNYSDTLQAFNRLSPVEQNAAELRRLEQAGVENELVRLRQTYLKNKLQSAASKNAYDEGANIFKEVLLRYKDYIGYKNKQFSNLTDKELKERMDYMDHNLAEARSLLLSTVPKTDAQTQAKNNTLAAFDRFGVQLVKEKDFVQKYIAADATGRKQLFMRR